MCLALLSLILPASAHADSLLPQPAGLDPDVQFWVQIYSEVGTNGGLIHDTRDLGIVYHKVTFSKGQSSRSRERQIERKKKQLVATLRKLGHGRRSGLSTEERRILALFPKGVSNKTLAQSSRQVRFQLGQADKFRAGVARSGAWKEYIEDTFRNMGLPTALAAIPHVESSFTPTAYSRVGAAGLWQFIRSTGRRYMRVDHVVDQRLDPYDATRAAGELLKANKLITGTWPLAITAYNHGASGMRRATRHLGTTDIEKVVREYKSRTFGFASRNFYVEFLAARHVSNNATRYFGRIELDKPIPYDSTDLPFHARASELASSIGVPLDQLRAANPALSRLVWNDEKFIPRGFTLRVPVDALPRPLASSIDSVPANRRYAAQTPDRAHRVRRGDTLSGIAARYGTSVRALAAMNSLRSSNRIRVGQVLRLPHSGRAPRTLEPMDIPSNGLYAVRRGDSVSRIASQFGLSEHQLLALNQLPNRNRIYPGQSLRVTQGAEKAATPPARVADGAKLAAASGQTAATSTEAAASPGPTPAPDAEPAREPEAADTPIVLAATTPEAALGAVEPAAPEAAVAAELDEPAAIELAAPAEMTLEAPASLGDAELPEDEASELARDLQADPADYSVAKDGTIEVQPAETLGHIAEWLDVRASRIRQMNGMRYGTALETHRHVELDFSRIDRAEFERRRLEHHRAVQAEYFERFEITGTRTHVVRRGDSIWDLSRSTGVPRWLLQQYNPDVEMEALQSGARLTIPEVRAHSPG